MPRTIHILGFSRKGGTALVSGPEVPISETSALVSQFVTSGKLPEGFVRLEVYDSEDGRTRTILPHDGGAAHRAEVAKIQAEAEKKAKAETKAAPEPEHAHPKGKGNKLNPI